MFRCCLSAAASNRVVHKGTDRDDRQKVLAECSRVDSCRTTEVKDTEDNDAGEVQRPP
jgi:hypothetical protein